MQAETPQAVFETPEKKQAAMLKELLAEIVVDSRAETFLGNVRGQNPDYAYSWIRHENVPVRMDAGWQVVRSDIEKDAHTGLPRAAKGDVSSDCLADDGRHVKNDLLLMFCPRELKERKDRKSALKSALMNDDSRSGILAKAAELGIVASVPKE